MRRYLLVPLVFGLALAGCQVHVIRPELALRVAPKAGLAPLTVEVEARVSPDPRSVTLSVGNQSAVGTRATFTLDRPGQYVVRAHGLDYLGRPFSLEESVTAYEDPTIEAFHIRGEGLVKTFTVQAKGEHVPLQELRLDPGLGYEIVWRASGLVAQATVDVTYPQTGSYTATLRVVNAQSRSAEARLDVKVVAPEGEGPSEP